MITRGKCSADNCGPHFTQWTIRTTPRPIGPLPAMVTVMTGRSFLPILRRLQPLALHLVEGGEDLGRLRSVGVAVPAVGHRDAGRAQRRVERHGGDDHVT